MVISGGIHFEACTPNGRGVWSPWYWGFIIVSLHSGKGLSGEPYTERYPILPSILDPSPPKAPTLPRTLAQLSLEGKVIPPKGSQL